jgi:hypothetical protein
MIKTCGGLAILLMCSMGADWNNYYYSQPVPLMVQPVVVAQPMYTLNYVPVVKQEIVLVPVVENRTIYYYYPGSRWVPQPAPWGPDPYTEWLRCRNYRY